MGFDWPTCSCLTLYLSCKPLEVSSEVSEYHWQQPHFTYLPLVFFPIEIKPQNDSALWWSSFFCHGMPSVVGKKDYWFWIRWDLHSDEFCILGALSRLAARSASTSLARLSISQTGMALMFTTMAPLCNLVNKAKTREQRAEASARLKNILDSLLPGSWSFSLGIGEDIVTLTMSDCSFPLCELVQHASWKQLPAKERTLGFCTHLQKPNSVPFIAERK